MNQCLVDNNETTNKLNNNYSKILNKINIKSSNLNKKFSFEKQLDRNYIEKLCVLLSSNDKNYKIKRFNLKDFVVKLDKNNQEYLTKSDFCEGLRNYYSINELNKNINLNFSGEKNKKDLSQINKGSSEFINNNKINKNNSLNKSFEIDYNNDNKEKIYNLVKTKSNKFLNDSYNENDKKQLNNDTNLLKLNSLNLNFFDEENDIKKLSFYKNANKLIFKVKILREYKNNIKKMDFINLFSYNKSLWNHKRFNNKYNNKQSYSQKENILPKIIFNIFKNENQRLVNSNKNYLSLELNLDNINEKIKSHLNEPKKKEIILNKEEVFNKMKDRSLKLYKILNESKSIKKLNINDINKNENINLKRIKKISI